MMDNDVFGVLGKILENKNAAKLLELIEANNYLLIGGQALAAYIKPRYTADYDFLLDKQGIALVKKQLDAKGISHKTGHGFIFIDDLSIDVVDASVNTIYSRVLSGPSKVFNSFSIPAAESLAALKFLSMTSRDSRPRQLIDLSDFISLVTLPGFDKFALTSFYRDTDRVDNLVTVLDAVESGQTNAKILSLLG